MLKSKKGKPVATQGKETFTWTGEHQEVFDLLKSQLTNAPLLGYADISLPFKPGTDAS